MSIFGKEWLKFEASINHGYFEEYLKLIKSKVEEENKRLSKIVNETEQAIQLEKDEGYTEQANSYLENLGFELDQFEQLMYRSFHITWFVFVENLFGDVCKHLKEERKELFGYKDITGSGIGRSVKYLEKLLGQPPILDKDIDNQFKLAWKIRNSFVHADSLISKDDLIFFKKYIKENPNLLHIRGQNRIELTFPYIESLLKLSSGIVNGLHSHF